MKLNRTGRFSARLALTTLALLGGVACNTSSQKQAEAARPVTQVGELGLQAEYFSKHGFAGPVLRQTDGQLAFKWGRSVAAHGLIPGNLSARWSGQLTAPKTGAYTLFLTEKDGVGRLWLDGREVGSGETVQLKVGQPVALRAEFEQRGQMPEFKLEWAGQGISRQVIPVGRFSQPAGVSVQNVATGTVPRGQNLLTNGDFEAGESSWTYGFLREESPTGQAALLKNGGYLQQNLPREAVEIGAVYTLSADAKSSTTEACTIGVAYFSPDGSVSKKTLDFGAVGADAWASASMDFTIPVGKTLMVTYLESHGGSCSFDNVDLRIKGEAEPKAITTDWLKFSDFEGNSAEVLAAWNTGGRIVTPGAGGAGQALQDANSGWSQQNVAGDFITSLKAGELYTLQASGRALNGGSCLVGFRGGNSTEVLFSKILDFRGDQWATHRTMDTLPAGSTWGAVYLASGEQECQFDDVRIGSVTIDEPVDDGEGIGPDMTYGSPIALEFPVLYPGDIAYFDIYGLGDDAYLGSDFQWDFGDGTTASGEAVQHNYEKMGTYTVTLNYKDGNGNPKSYSTQVAAINIADVVSSPATSDSFSIEFNAGPEIKGMEYEWTFGDGHQAQESRLTHDYGKIGSYIYTLKITDKRGEQTGLQSQALTAQKNVAAPVVYEDSSLVTVWRRPPEAKFSWTGSQEPNTPVVIIPAGQSEVAVTFSAEGSRDHAKNSPRGISKYEWQVDDGPVTEGETFTYAFSETRPHLVTLTVTNTAGLKDTEQIYFYARDKQYATTLQMSYAGEGLVLQSLGESNFGAQSLEFDGDVQSEGDADTYVTSTYGSLQGLNVSPSFQPHDDNSEGEIPYILPYQHNFARGFHRPRTVNGIQSYSICNSYKLFVNGEYRGTTLLHSDPHSPIVQPGGLVNCGGMVLGPDSIPKLTTSGWNTILISSSLNLNTTRVNVIDHLVVPEILVTVVPDAELNGQQASPVLREYHQVDPESGKKEYLLKVLIRESEVDDGGQATIAVPVRAATADNKLLQQVNGQLYAQFSGVVNQARPVTMVNGKAYLDFKINLKRYREGAEKLDLNKVTFFSSNGDCGVGAGAMYRATNQNLRGCITVPTSHVFPDEVAVQDVQPLPAVLQQSFKLKGHTIYGTDKDELSRSMSRDAHAMEYASLELLDNVVPVLAKERFEETQQAARDCFEAGECTMEEAKALARTGFFTAMDAVDIALLPIGVAKRTLVSTGTALYKQADTAIEAAIRGKKSKSLNDILEEAAGPVTARALVKCASQVCFDSLNSATNTLQRAGYTPSQAMNKFDLNLNDIQRHNKANNYNTTKPEEFAEAKRRTICGIGGHSFTPDTLVHAAQGFLPISQLKVNDKVLAYNEATEQNGYYPITAVHRHMDDSITTLKLQTEDGQLETLTTTPEHPFYVTTKAGNGIRPVPIGHEGLNEHWVGAGHLVTGDKLKLADGRVGEVRNVTTEAKTLEMFNLTVAEAHTFYVGTQGWLVHNCDPIEMAAGLHESAKLRSLLTISNRKSIAYAEAYLPNFKGRIVGWSGLDTKSPTMAARAGGIRFADNPPRELENVKGMVDGERKLLDTLRKELTPDSKGTISLFIDPTARANGGALGACQVCSDAILQFRRDFPNITLNVTSR